MNITLQTATIGASLFAAVLLKAGNPSPATVQESRKAAEIWTASTTAEQSGDYTGALKQTAAWRQAGGDLYVATLRSAWLYYRSGDYAKAVEFYHMATTQQPAALTPVLGLLATAQAMNDGAKIQAAAERVLKLEPANYKALMALAGYCYATGDYRKSRGCYLRVLGSYPEDTDALSGAAWCAFQLGDRREAQKGFQRIASMNPDYPFVQEGLALAAR